MKTVKVSDLFEVKYGTNLELVNLEECEQDGANPINFVSRTSKDNGISACVEKMDSVKPNPANTISVAGGGSVLSTFFHKKAYYSGRDMYILLPKRNYSDLEMLFYTYVVRKNKYRYNYGRQANKTLKDILIPEKMPENWKKISISHLNNLKERAVFNKKITLNIKNWHFFKLTDLFEISASTDELIDNLTLGGNTPYITSSDRNNGVTSYVEEEATNESGTITANRGGSVGYFYYQPIKYKATPVDVRILTPKFQIDAYVGLFLKTILQLERYRFNYSRKMGSARLKEMLIKLPTNEGRPDWRLMGDYVKSLPYSENIKN